MGNGSEHGTRYYWFFQRTKCPAGTIFNFLPAFISSLVILPESFGRKACLALKACSLPRDQNRIHFLTGSLPELFARNLYLIHKMQTADVFSFATSLKEKFDCVVQRLNKMKAAIFATIRRYERDLRFDWPPCFQVFSNRPDKAPQMIPRRSSTQRAFLKSRDSTAVPSAPISETPVQCRRKLASDFRLRYEWVCEDGGFQ
jgi:hypothetical protein